MLSRFAIVSFHRLRGLSLADRGCSDLFRLQKRLRVREWGPLFSTRHFEKSKRILTFVSLGKCFSLALSASAFEARSRSTFSLIRFVFSTLEGALSKVNNSLKH